MSESSVILAWLSFKKHSCKTLRLCHAEPNQHAYIRRELPHEKNSHGYTFYMVREQRVSNKAQGGQQFLHQGSLLRVKDPVTFRVSRLDYQPLFGK